MDILKAEIERKRKLLEDKKLVVCEFVSTWKIIISFASFH